MSNLQKLMNKDSLKAELEKLKVKANKLKEQPNAKNLVYSIIGNSLTPMIHDIAKNYTVKRTHTGKYRVHGKTYRTRKLAEKAWYNDSNILLGKTKGKRNLVESVLVPVGVMAPVLVPAIMNSKWMTENVRLGQN